MFQRFIKAAAYSSEKDSSEKDKMNTAAVGAMLLGLSLSAPALSAAVPMFGVAGIVVAITLVATVLAVFAIRYWASKVFEYRHGPEPVVAERVPSLLDLSARALPYERAREHMEQLAELQPGTANDERIAAALVEKYPEGLDKHLQRVAQKAWLKGKLGEQYSAKSRQGPDEQRKTVSLCSNLRCKQPATLTLYGYCTIIVPCMPS